MDIDVTILIQAGIVLFLLLSLNGLLFKPLLEVFDAREAKLQGARDSIESLNRLAKDDLEAYRTRIREANDRAQDEKEALRDDGRARERELLSEVRAEIADSLNDARSTIEAQEGQARQSLSVQVDTLAGDMASKILGREVEA
ncbi:MAG: ATP synthase F0 subunit B [Myxococcota bacterium]